MITDEEKGKKKQKQINSQLSKEKGLLAQTPARELNF